MTILKRKNNFTKITIFLLVLVLVAMPLFTFAQGAGGCFGNFQADKKIGGLFNYLTCLIISSVVPLLFGLALALFIWGVVQFLANPADEDKRTKGKQFMLWGIIALTVMFAVWGLVGIVANSFDIKFDTIPSLNTQTD